MRNTIFYRVKFILLVTFVTAYVGCSTAVPTTVAPVTVTIPVHPSSVVFLGDSLIFNWNLSTSFPGQNYTNKGIGGQTTAQIAARFQTDVVALKPDAVIVMGGTNDIWDGITDLTIPELNIEQMKQMADASGIVMVLCTIPPMRGDLVPLNPEIAAYNQWIREYTSQQLIPLIDFENLLKDSNGNLNVIYAFVLQDGTPDHVHLNAAAYAAMTPLVTEAIQSIDLKQ